MGYIILRKISQLLIVLLFLTSFYSCAQKEGANTAASGIKERDLLEEQHHIYLAADAKDHSSWRTNKAKKNLADTGIQGTWISADLKKYLLNEDPAVNKMRIDPLGYSIEKDEVYFLSTYKLSQEFYQLKSIGNDRYLVNKNIFSLKNDTTLSVQNSYWKEEHPYLKIQKGEEEPFYLSAALNEKIIDYSRLKAMLTINSEGQAGDTLNLICSRSKVSDFILCSTKMKNFRYKIGYTVPQLFKNFQATVYLLRSEGLNEEKDVVYELERRKDKVLMRERGTGVLKYIFLYKS